LIIGHAIYIVISRYPNAGKEIETISSSDYIPWEKHPHRDPIGFVLRLGRALHTFGYSADRLEAVLTKCSERLGLKSQFFSTPTSIFVSFGEQEDQRTYLIRVEPGAVNLAKLADLDIVTSGVLSERFLPLKAQSKSTRSSRFRTSMAA